MAKVLSRWLRWLALMLALTMGYGIASTAAQADDAPASEPAFAIAPAGEVEGAYFSATMEPGTQQTMTAALVNAGESAFAARTFAADAYTLPNGGMGVKEDGSEPTGPTTWIDYQAETLTLEPRGTVERNFTVTVPSDTPPGQYITGIVLQTAEPIPLSGSTAFNQILRKTVAVFVTVPGPIQPGLAIGAVALTTGQAWTTLTVEVANTGNVLVRPAGALILRDGSGSPVLSAPAEMGPVYAGHATTIELLLGELLPAGDYTVDVDLADATYELSVWASEAVTVRPPATPVPPPPLTIGAVALTPLPSAEAVQYLDVALHVVNNGEPVTDARVVLHVVRDGESVEDFPLASSLALRTGITDVRQRYIPADGWAPGAYTFALTLETVDPSNGVALVVADAAIEGGVAVP